MKPLKRKVKLPALAGALATLVLALLAGLGTVPELAPACTAASTALTTALGYLVAEA